MLELTISENVNPGRIGIDDGELNPVVRDKSFHGDALFENVEHGLRCRLDDHEQPDRLMDLDHLPRQARTQIARRAVHHAHQGRDVVRQFRSAAVTGRIRVGKKVFQIDAGADGDHGMQNPCQEPMLGVVLSRIE